MFCDLEVVIRYGTRGVSPVDGMQVFHNLLGLPITANTDIPVNTGS